MRAVTFDVPPPPPTLPARRALLLAFLAVVVAGVFGALIGYGLADLSTVSSSTIGNLVGALIGATIGAGGVGIVAVLTLRAMTEWRQHPADTESPAGSESTDAS